MGFHSFTHRLTTFRTPDAVSLRKLISAENGSPGVQSGETVIKLLTLVLQLGFLLLVIQQFHLVSLAFYHYVIQFTFLGFIIQCILPFRYRLPFFIILFLACTWKIFGTHDGGWLVAIGLTLIGICHLPFSFLVRSAILFLIWSAVATARVNLIALPVSGAIWPIVGSIFMFRLIIYMHDLKYKKAPSNVWYALAYFFLLPNLTFPLFPVVDYSTFRRTYYNDKPHKIFQKGIRLILLGVIHLILYRFVSYYLMIPAENISNAIDLARYLVSNFLLYLQVSGLFHLTIGLLHMFGFNLPMTHNNYFLASSFTDFWRRANIYWKDFMLKVVYYPAYFRLRKRGATVALVLSTLLVFFATWFLHSYQWFWLKGKFLFSGPDVLFWSIFALLMLANSLYEAKYGRRRVLGSAEWTFKTFSKVALRTIATFSVICILWSLWTSMSISDWISLWSMAGLIP